MKCLCCVNLLILLSLPISALATDINTDTNTNQGSVVENKYSLSGENASNLKDYISVFGIKLDAPFELFECSGNYVYGEIFYDTMQKEICYERQKYYTSNDYETKRFNVTLPFDTAPGYIKDRKMYVYEYLNKVDKIQFYTTGIDSSKYVLKTLVEKFGNPTGYEEVKLQNRMGATFESFEATWNNDQIYIEFNPTYGSLDHGYVNIHTREGKLRRDEKLKDEEKKSLKM